MDRNTPDDKLIAEAQLLFRGSELSEEIDGDRYNEIVGELIHRGYTPVISVNFSKG